MMWTVGSLFTGVLGLDWPWLDMDHRWVSEMDADASLVLEKRMPGVPNLGDVTEIDWSNVEPVDVLIGGGFPCQPFSQAGKRKGEDDDRYLWPEVVRSVRALRPRLVVLENSPTVVTRADGLPRFASDLAEVGYDLRWTSLRAADVGAPHRRRRWLAVAYPCGVGVGPGRGSDRGDVGVDDRRGPADVPGRSEVAHAENPPTGRGDTAADSGRVERERLDGLEGDAGNGGEGEGEGRRGDTRRSRLLPTPNAWDGARGPDYAKAGRAGAGGDDLTTLAAKLFPTPTAALALGGNHTRGGDRSDEPLLGGLHKLLPTPVAMDSHGARNATLERKPGKAPSTGWTMTDVAHAERWGAYADAINRWMPFMGLPPDPVDEGRRLEAPFVEWMMGFPAGWVTDLVPRRAALRLLGNAVVPHVAVTALAMLLEDTQ